MKQGSHIMLQRFVRSMVSTDPRPYFTVEDRGDAASRQRARQCRVRGKRLPSASRNRVDRHHVFEVAVDGAVFHHQNLSVALNDSGLDLADFFVHQNFVRQFAVKNLLADFRTHFGHSESVERGQPSGGFDFS